MRVFLTLLAVLMFCWLGGLGIFLWRMNSLSTPSLERTDAIVVLTGGSLRVEHGFALLGEGLADALFISGVGKQVTLEELLAEYGNLRARERIAAGQAEVVLDHRANSTMTNAAEAAQFIRARGFHSVRLVTSNYHMPRSVLEFRAALPEVTLLPDTVYPEALRGRSWWQEPATRQLVLVEFHKYWAAWLRTHILAGSAA